MEAAKAIAAMVEKMEEDCPDDAEEPVYGFDVQTAIERGMWRQFLEK